MDAADMAGGDHIREYPYALKATGAPSDASMRLRHTVVVLLPLAIPVLASPGPGCVRTPAIRLEHAWPALRFQRPIFMACLPGWRFVVEQGGRILAFPDLTDAAQPTCFLDLSESVLREGRETGLLGMAFHPRFLSNGYFYVYYSDRRSWRGGISHRALLSRFQVRPGATAADPSSETILMSIEQPYANHNGGGLLFGPDGLLYLGLGDGGSAGDPQDNAQNPHSLLGKMLRLDVDHPSEGRPYGIPRDNPYAGRSGTGREEIFALGLRNPWRFSFDRQTGDLWAGDNGQNALEEVDRIVRGGNYGWNRREGSRPFRKASGPQPIFLPPVAEYGPDEGSSVIGGYVYRGRRHPALAGMYLYADYVSGKVWGVRPGATSVLLAERGLSISSFAEDEEGELSLISLDGGIWRILPG